MALLLALPGCESAPILVAASGGGGGSGGAGGAATGSLQVLVVDAFDLTPVEGAHVAVNYAAGGQGATLTGADGKAVLANLRSELPGVLDIVAYAEGYTYWAVSRGHLERLAPGDEVVLRLRRLEPVAVTLSGTAQGMAGPGHVLVVSACMPPSSMFAMQQASWSIEVPPGKPFGLSAIELDGVDPQPPQGSAAQLFNWFWAEQPALTGDGSVDIDFSGPSSVQPHTAKGPRKNKCRGSRSDVRQLRSRRPSATAGILEVF